MEGFISTGTRGVLRPFLTALSIVVPVATTCLPAWAVEQEFTGLREEWIENRDELTQTTADLESLDGATAAATEAFERVERRLEAARERLRVLRGELALAVARQREAEAANDVAFMRLGQATMVMATVEDALAAHTTDLDVEIVAAYKYAGSSARFRGMVNALQTSGSITEFGAMYEQLETGTVRQQELVEVVTVLAARLEEQRELVGALQRRTAAAAERAVEEQARVATLTRRQSDLVEEVLKDRRTRERLLAQLQSKQAQVTRRLDELQAQSQSLLEELSRYRYVGGAPGSKDLVWPTDGAFTSAFGYRLHPIWNERRLHAGIDIPGPTGQPVYAARDGVVASAGPRGGYGIAVVIRHPDGMSTTYAHLDSVGVTAGTTVLAGDDIGRVGSSGLSTGPHLHFEVRLGGVPADPMEWY